MRVKAAIFNLDAGVSRGGCGAAGELGERRHITGHAHPEHAAAEPPCARQLELGGSCSLSGPAQAGAQSRHGRFVDLAEERERDVPAAIGQPSRRHPVQVQRCDRRRQVSDCPS
jgi:hypothetical protein